MNIINRHHQLNLQDPKGFSLVELLLSVFIMIGLVVAILFFVKNMINDATDAKVASEMKQLQVNAEHYVEMNFDSTLALIPNLNDVAELNIAMLAAQGFLPVGYNAVNAYGQTMRIFIRHISDITDVTSYATVIEVVTLGDDTGGNNNAMRNKRLMNAAVKGGPSVGTITNLTLPGTGCCIGQIVGSTKTWSLNVSDWTGYAATAGANDGYIAAYGRVSNRADVLNNNYLFRDGSATIANGNVMETNLHMGGNDVSNVGVLVTDSIYMRPNSDVTINGTPSNGVQSPYILAIENDFSSVNTLDIRANNVIDKGNIYMRGDLTAGNVTVPNRFVGATVSTPTMDVANNATIEMATVTGNIDSANIYTTDMNWNGVNLSTNILQTEAINGSVANLSGDNASIGLVDAANATLNAPTFVSSTMNARGGVYGEAHGLQNVTITTCQGNCN